MEFLAEKEKISILTNFSENKIYLIGVGNFTSLYKTKLLIKCIINSKFGMVLVLK